jgi:hypothetical protein
MRSRSSIHQTPVEAVGGSLALEISARSMARKGLLAAVLAGFGLWVGLGSLSSAQEVATDPVGFTTIGLSPGYNSVSVSLVKAPVLIAKVNASAGVSGNTITLTAGAPTNVGSILEPSKKYYFEVIKEGANQMGYEGERFEINVSSTIAAANNTLVAAFPSETNTMSELPNLSDYQITIREHITMFDIFGGLGNNFMRGSSSAGTSDQVMFYNNATNAFETYWLRSNAGNTVVQWRSLDVPTDQTDYSSKTIPPGAGVFVYRQPSAGNLSFRVTGAVRITPFRQPLPAGYSLQSHPAPLDHSIAYRQMSRENGFAGSSSPSDADQLQIWDGSQFQVYYFRSNVSGSVQQWRNVDAGDPVDYKSVEGLINGDQAVLFRKLTADPNYIIKFPE